MFSSTTVKATQEKEIKDENKELKYPNEQVQQTAIARTLTSIKNHGVCHLGYIPRGTVLPNITTNLQDLECNVCVNYVDLSGASSEEQKNAITVCCEEEYTGIYGILLERQWPLQQPSVVTLLQEEMSSRLLNSMVFILKPPTLYPFSTTTLHGANGASVAVAFYKINIFDNNDAINNDGFNQTRGVTVTSNKKIISARVTEIKTSYIFHRSDTIAILAPEPLLDSVKSVFNKSLPIYPVPIEPVTLVKLPEILFKMHSEKLNGPVKIDAPQYAQVLHQLIKGNKIPDKFSLHTVRLHTPCDFSPRFFPKLAEQNKLINSAQGTIVRDYSNGSGWIIVHKSFATSKKEMIKKLESELPKETIEKLRQVNESKEKIYNSLVQAKGENKTNYVYAPLCPYQSRSLEKWGAEVIKMHHYYAVSFPPNLEKDVKNIISNWKNMEKQAAVKIQKIFRGHYYKKLFLNYKRSVQKEKAAIEALTKATNEKVAIEHLLFKK